MSTGKSDKIIIRGGRVIDPANKLDEVLDIHVANGVIAAIGTQPDGFKAATEIDATGNIVIPGIVDLCARMREPGMEYKTTIASETRAAASSGITTLCCPPDTNPVIDTPAVIELIRLRAQAAGKARIVNLGALTRGLAGEQLSEMAALKNAGCVGVSNAMRPLANTLVERRALEYAASFDLTVFLNPNDHWLFANGCAHEGKVSTRLGLPGIPAAAEVTAVARDLALIEQTGARAHFCHLTTAKAVHMVARAQFDGVPVTADVALPYFYFSEIDIADFDTQYHVIPPFRTVEDRERLLHGLQRNTLSAICSDHQPHEPDAKRGPFPTTEPGISGLDTLLPMSLKLVDDNVIELSDLVERLTIGPAKILGLPFGTLATNAVADICIFDPEITWQLDTNSMKSHGHNTPFLGWEMKGRVTHTLLAGKPVFELQS